jgi:hypothetical protein
MLAVIGPATPENMPTCPSATGASAAVQPAGFAVAPAAGF